MVSVDQSAQTDEEEERTALVRHNRLCRPHSWILLGVADGDGKSCWSRAEDRAKAQLAKWAKRLCLDEKLKAVFPNTDRFMELHDKLIQAFLKSAK